jgi:hypothetical protein
MAAINRDVATGRRIKGREGLTARPRRSYSLADYARYLDSVAQPVEIVGSNDIAAFNPSTAVISPSVVPTETVCIATVWSGLTKYTNAP